MSEGVAMTAACRPTGPWWGGKGDEGTLGRRLQAGGGWARQGLPAQVRMGVRRK